MTCFDEYVMLYQFMPFYALYMSYNICFCCHEHAYIMFQISVNFMMPRCELVIECSMPLLGITQLHVLKYVMNNLFTCHDC